MQRYSAVSIIFNPKSTTSSRTKAEAFSRQLQDELPGASIAIIPTEYAGHAEELAYELARATPKPLIISASGDGGYNEVVNGVMRARAEGADVVTGLLPAGNANDHYRSVRSGGAEPHALRKRMRRIDLLQITMTTHGGHTWQRFAHSYAGVGFSANIVQKLNQIALNPVNEWVVAVRMLYNSPPVNVIVQGQKQRYDNLLFSNVSRLAKVFFLSDKSKVDDGKFEVIALQSKTKAAMMRSVARALTVPAEEVADVSSAKTFTFQTTEKVAMQMDGEIITLDPGTKVTVRSAHRALHCII